MKFSKTALSILITLALLAIQVGVTFAAPSTQEGAISGVVTGLSCTMDASTGATIFEVTIEDADGVSHIFDIDQAYAEELELIYTNEDGSPDCSEEALAESIGWEVLIDPTRAIPEEPQHPVGGALATFFEDITDYDTIMEAHENGVGFGVIAQALWMAQKLEGDSDIFLAILAAKKSGDYSEFTFEDGSSPENWGQFRKAVMGGEKGNLGIVMSDKDDKAQQGNGNGNNGNHGNGNNGKNGDKGNGKDKGKDK